MHSRSSKKWRCTEPFTIELQLLRGRGQGDFVPKAALTRAEAVQALVNLLDKQYFKERRICIRKELIYLTDDHRVSLTAYLYESFSGNTEARAAVVVLPGGGYRSISESEADPIALSYLSRGYHAFVLRYSIGEFAAFPAPLIEVSRALSTIRRNGASWGVDVNRIAVCGLSAGGHLAASLGTMWQDKEIAAAAGIDSGENRPNALILGYPVITCSLGQHSPLNKMWTQAAGKPPLPDMQSRLSCELLVDGHTPPCFIFHTFADQVVPVQHALLFSTALADHQVPFELHVYQDGPHGLSLANAVTAGGKVQYMNETVAQWMEQSCRWLQSVFKDNDQVND